MEDFNSKTFHPIGNMEYLLQKLISLTGDMPMNV